jgi:type II secretory pathway pseudopilin PulG
MMNRLRSQSGFSLAEVLVATGLLLAVSSIVTSALLQLTKQQQTVWNRTEMHSGVRGATELLQQEVGQAGKIALPGPVTLTGSPVTTVINPTSVCVVASTVLSSVAGMWVDPGVPQRGIGLTFLDGDRMETVRVLALDAATKTITGCFWYNHDIGAPVVAMGGFATGIIPPIGIVSGSTANKLKLFGDINGDGNMVYIEYYCDNGDPGTAGSFNLYRNVMPFQTTPAVKASTYAVTNANILLSNVHPNPPDSTGFARPCFQYQTVQLPAQGTTFTFVLDVAVTLTAWTQTPDPVTHQFQTETKALLNVSPRNVFSAWALTGMGYTERIQSTPGTVTALLP